MGPHGGAAVSANIGSLNTGYTATTASGLAYMPPPKHCWLAYHADWSGFAVFLDEKAALRHAVDHSMSDVVALEWGQDPHEAVNQ
jgi:hypothetical protein